MSPEWRLLRDGITDAHHHFAVEEAVVRLMDEGVSPPTLRLRQVRRAVFVGVYQDTRAEVDVDYCRQNNIKIVRRANGGGAVYHDVGSFCYSAFFPRSAFVECDDELYALFAQPVVQTCADYDLTAAFHGRNDVQIGQRKIYGSAQMAWYNTFVQSGTFLVDIDFDVMDRALTPPDIKFADKPARSVKERVTSLTRELGRPVDATEVMGRFARHLADHLALSLAPGPLTPPEEQLAAELLATKYGTDQWNLGGSRASTVTMSAKTDSGVVTLSLKIVSFLIREASITGDLLVSDSTAISRLEHDLVDHVPQDAWSVVQKAALPEDLKWKLAEMLMEIGREGTASPTA